MSYKYFHKGLQFTNRSIHCGLVHRNFDGGGLAGLRRIKINRNLNVLQYDIRRIHLTCSLLDKEITGDKLRHGSSKMPDIIASTNIEKLKESMQKNQNNKPITDSKSAPLPASTANKQQEVVPAQKLSLWQRVKKEILHYYHGFKLLFLEIKVAIGILNTLTKGQSLTRRERKQLVRTSADLLRMIPFLVFVIVPFMEFLLPFYIKFFPFMMPSTFQEDASKKTDKTRQILKGKLEIAKFLQETLTESTGAKKEQLDGKVNIRTFSNFLKEVRESGLTANTEDILRYSQLFEDEVTLESLEHSQLKALCKMLELNVIGPPTLLRFQLRMKVRHLKVDDQLIASEGIDKVPVWELQQLCRERGMRSIGVSEERLRYQLSQWLSLHLDNKVPITLLLLTRIIYLPDTLTPEEKLKQAILVLPNSVSNEAKLKVVATEERIDHKTKFEVIKEEQKVIKKEREQAKKDAQVAVADVKIDAVEKLKVSEDQAPIIMPTPAQPDIAPKVEIPKVSADSAPVIKTDEAAKDVAKEVKPEISLQDLSQIESAIVKLKETKELFTKEEIEDLKESREEISNKLPKVDVPIPEEKAKKVVEERIGAKVDKIISEIDTMFDTLNKEDGEAAKEKDKIPSEEPKVVTQEKVVEAKKAAKERFINIADLKTILRQMDKLPDDAKWQHILSVLDEDGDGMLEIDHVMQMVQLLGTEKVKLSNAEVSNLLEMLDKEAIVAETKKTKPTSPDK